MKKGKLRIRKKKNKIKDILFRMEKSLYKHYEELLCMKLDNIRRKTFSPNCFKV